MTKLLSILLFLCILSFHSAAQDTLSVANTLRGGDRMVRQRIFPILPGDDGRDVIWDFRDTQVTGEEEIVYKGDTLVTETGRRSVQRYIVNGNGTWQTGWENTLEKMEYRDPVCLARYPMTYGDSLSCPFSGRGRYCDLYDVDVCGTHEVEADAYGSIIVGEADTLRHVIRLHSVRMQSVAMDAPSERLDSALALRHQIEERYVWYARGYRYPVFEVLSRASYYKLALVSTYQTAFQCLPGVQRTAFTDSLNEEIARRDSISALSPRQEAVRYSVSVSGSEVIVGFDLDAPAQMTFLLCDVRGMVYRKAVFSEDPGTGHLRRFGCSGLHAGEYILYMNFNGQIYSEKICL